MGRVTVVIPAFNAARYITAALETVLRQTFQDFDVLVLDNASTDDTATVVQPFVSERVHYVRNPSNVGFAGNIALGRRLARGELIAYLGADDLWEPTFLATCVEMLDAERKLSFVHSAAVWIDDFGSIFGRSTDGWKRVTEGSRAFVDCFRYGFTFPAMVMRAEALQRAGEIDLEWGDFADLWIFLRLSLEGDVGYCSKPLVQYRVHSQNLSGQWFSSGDYFRCHLRFAEEAFDWPQAQRRKLGKRRHIALRCIAIEALRTLHLVRISATRLRFLRAFGEILATTPSLVWYPATWARLGFGLLPARVIAHLRDWRRNRSAAGHTVVSEQPAEDVAG